MQQHSAISRFSRFLLFAAIAAVNALPSIKVGHSDLDGPDVIESRPSAVVPAGYPPYGVALDLYIDAPSLPEWHGAALVGCGYTSLPYIMLCADKSAKPLRLIFQDIFAVPGRDLAAQGNWNQHVEAFSPMPQVATPAQSIHINKDDLLRDLPSNRLFEGVMADVAEGGKKIGLDITGLDETDMTLLGISSNSKVYSVHPQANSTIYNFYICTGEAHVPSNRLVSAASFIHSGVRQSSNNSCNGLKVGLRAEIAHVLDPSSPLLSKTAADLLELPAWGKTPDLGIDEAPQEYTEALTLTTRSTEHPEFDGLTVEPCNPKPFIDQPHVPTEWTGPAPSWWALKLNTLPLFLSIYKSTLFLCVNQTGIRPSLRYSADTKSEHLPRIKNPLNAGSIWDPMSISVSDYKVGVDADGEVYYWNTTTPTQLYESRSSDWYICEASPQDKTVRIQVLTARPGAYGPKALGTFGPEIDVAHCTPVNLQRTAHEILDPKLDSPEGVLKARYSNIQAPNEDAAIEALYGGPESPYYDWIRNLTIVSKKPGSHMSIATPFGMLLSMY